MHALSLHFLGYKILQPSMSSPFSRFFFFLLPMRCLTHTEVWRPVSLSYILPFPTDRLNITMSLSNVE